MKASYETRAGYLYVKVSGEFDSISAKRILHEWLAKARSAGLTRVLCDITLVTGLGSQLELTMTVYHIASFVAESLPKEFRLAILESQDQFPEDRFGENVMRNKGARVKTTTSLTEALQWLGLPQPRKIPALAHCCA